MDCKEMVRKQETSKSFILAARQPLQIIWYWLPAEASAR